MPIGELFATAMLAAFLWAAGFLLPKAAKDRDALALTSAAMLAVLALLSWLLIGVGVRGSDLNIRF